MCGEKTGLSSRISPCGGSPPRVRGKVATLTFFRLFSGITPACAGKSKFKNIFFHGCKDHPRVCGEKGVAVLTPLLYRGSPPRVRGKGCVYKLTVLATRITPACAGKSDRIAGGFYLLEDHPRVCGEKLYPFRFFLTHPGSPPRVRGKVLAYLSGDYIPGITPACAGKSTAAAVENSG